LSLQAHLLITDALKKMAFQMKTKYFSFTL